MRQLRFLAFAVISFVAALLGDLLSPSTWLHKSLAVALCGVLSANPALCTNNAIAVHSQEASATNPVKVETTKSSDLLTQRSRDFDDQSTTSPRINQRSNPPTSDPNTNFIRPEFDNPNLGNTPLNPNNSSQTAKSNSTCSLTGKWQYKANSDFGISDGNLIQGPIPYEAPVQITENSGQIEISGFYNASNGSGQGKRSGSTVTARLPLQIPILGAGKADLTGTLSSDDKTIQGQVTVSKNSGGNSVSIPFTMTRQTPCSRAIFDLTSFNSLNLNNYEFSLVSKEGGCVISANFTVNENESHFVSAKYTSRNVEVCGPDSYNFEFINRYEKVVISSSSGQKVIYDSLQKKFVSDSKENRIASQKYKSLITSNSDFSKSQNFENNNLMAEGRSVER
jgi:hypothetical protein